MGVVVVRVPLDPSLLVDHAVPYRVEALEVLDAGQSPAEVLTARFAQSRAARTGADAFDWSLVAGRWSLVAGRWSLVAGRWSLVAGREN